MTLGDLKAQGFFSTMSDTAIVSLCKSLKVNVTDMTSTIDAEAVNRLNYSYLLNDYRVKDEVTKQHQSVIAKYQELIDKYKEMLKSISPYSTFASETASITNLISNLENEKKSYEAEIGKFTINKPGQYFDYNSGNIAKGISSIASDIAKSNNETDKAINDELSQLYDSVDRLKMKNSKTLTNRVKDNIKMANLERKINRLRKKQGRLHNSQQRIIVTNTSLYVNSMDRRFDKYFKEQNRINDAIENKKADIREIKSLKQETIDEEKRIAELEVAKLNSGAFGKIGINMEQKKAKRDKEKMLKRLDQLRKKQGKVNISKQFSVEFNRNFAR